MAMSYKGHGEQVFVIFNNVVHPAKITGTNSARGVVTGFRVHIPTAKDRFDHPVSTDVKKRCVFKDEEVAKQAYFTRSLQGEYNDG